MNQPTQPQSYEAMALANAINMVAQSPTFQSLLPAGANPLNYIVEAWGGTIDFTQGEPNKANATNGATVDTTGVHAVVHEPDMQDEFAGAGFYHHHGTTEVMIYQLRETPTDTSAADCLRRGRNIQGGIRDDINSTFGTSTSVLATGECKTMGPWLPDESSVDATLIEGRISITWWA